MVRIKPTVGQFYNLNGTEYKFVKSGSLGCGACDLYPTLKTPVSCNCECGYGVMKKRHRSAAIICPYCGATITYPIHKESGTRCNKCNEVFKIDYIGD